MTATSPANLERMAIDDRRAMLLAVPNVGKVTRRRGRIVLDFSPELRGTDRYLWTFSGRAFESEAAAESVRQRICQDAAHMPLPDAIARFRGIAAGPTKRRTSSTATSRPLGRRRASEPGS